MPTRNNTVKYFDSLKALIELKQTAIEDQRIIVKLQREVIEELKAKLRTERRCCNPRTAALNILHCVTEDQKIRLLIKNNENKISFDFELFHTATGFELEI